MEQISSSRPQRIYFMDYLRVFACFMVMIVHASENFYLCPAADAPAGEMVNVVSRISTWDNRFWVSLLDGFCRMSVPLFMIASSYLLCPMKETVTWKEFFTRRALRVVPPMVVFLVLYSALPLLWGGTTTDQAVRDLLYIPFNMPGTAGHMWFLYPLLSMYLFIPIISPWLRKATARQERMFLYLFMLSTLIPFFNRYGYDVFGQVFWNPYHALFPFSGYLGYLVLGHYLRFHVHWSDAKRVAVGLPCLIVGAAATILSFYLQIQLGVEQDPSVVEIAWCFCTPNVVVLTVGFFLLISTIKKPLAGYPLVEDISKLSYGMYLMHMFFLTFYAGLIVPLLPVWLAIPAIALATFASCYVLTKVISFVPGSKWVIG